MIARMPEHLHEPDPRLAEAVAGNRSALGELAEVYYPQLRRWALLETGRKDLAEDAVQEALVRLVRFIHTYDPAQPFEPWLRTLVRNAARDARQRKPLLDWIPFFRPASTERSVDLSRSARTALGFIERLTPRQRELVDLCDLQGNTAAEAARRLDIDPATARVHLHEAHRRLRDWMGPEVHSILTEVKP